ncbi:MAG: hypothetical protein OXP66_06200 [Candidatus Tectomicrobia bacterium]|nr:hypothetical protein [Candidatus Tectomicrobia bacterium]
MASVTLAELKHYIADLQEGLALRFDDLDKRLDRIETDIALIKEHLVRRMRKPDDNDLNPWSTW